jgi:hypothetical protein
VDSRFTVNVKWTQKTEHSDPKQSQVAGHQRILHSKGLYNLLAKYCDVDLVNEDEMSWADGTNVEKYIQQCGCKYKKMANLYIPGTDETTIHKIVR